METVAKREVISPEGVEERVEYECAFRITLTGGGKFRLYVIGQDGKAFSVDTKDDKEEAMKSLGMGMIMHGGLLSDPKKTLDLLLSAMDKKS